MTTKNILQVILVILAPAVAGLLIAASVSILPTPREAARGQNCATYTALAATALTGTASFTVDQDDSVYRPLVDVSVVLVDADTSITRLDMTCTLSSDANATDYSPQSISVSGGVATLTDGLKFQRASPGTKNMVIDFDLRSMPDFECAFTVGTGSATAVVDTVAAEVSICSR